MYGNIHVLLFDMWPFLQAQYIFHGSVLNPSKLHQKWTEIQTNTWEQQCKLGGQKDSSAADHNKLKYNARSNTDRKLICKLKWICSVHQYYCNVLFLSLGFQTMPWTQCWQIRIFPPIRLKHCRSVSKYTRSFFSTFRPSTSELNFQMPPVGKPSELSS